MPRTEALRKAHAAARVYLELRGYATIEQNFRRPRGEVDIIASKNGTIYFVAVNYTSDEAADEDVSLHDAQLRRLNRGAMFWIEESKWRGAYKLSSIDITGSHFIVMSFIDSVLA